MEHRSIDALAHANAVTDALERPALADSVDGATLTVGEQVKITYTGDRNRHDRHGCRTGKLTLLFVPWRPARQSRDASAWSCLAVRQPTYAAIILRAGLAAPGRPMELARTSSRAPALIQ